MRSLLLLVLLGSATLSVKGQPIPFVSTFDTLYLSQPDTFYINYSAPGTDVGFSDVELHFPCIYDTSSGFSFWSKGFAYSNVTDSVTSGLLNQYAAKAGKGYNGSSNYAVAYGNANTIRYANTPAFKYWKGFYITNSTYAYNSMRDGDAFAKKFGGASGNDPDWFKLTIKPYMGGQVMNDSFEFYLADFRDLNNSNDYIIRDWSWVNLPLNWVGDSLLLTLSSSDTGQFGMNTPAYYCLDNVTIEYIADDVTEVAVTAKAKVYPNPATHLLNIELQNADYNQAVIIDMTGKVLGSYRITTRITSISTEHLAHGTYLLQLNNGSSKVSMPFAKY